MICTLHFNDAIAQFDADDEILVLADLWSGSPFNQLAELLEKIQIARFFIILDFQRTAMATKRTLKHMMDLPKKSWDYGMACGSRDRAKALPEELNPAEETTAAPVEAAAIKNIPEGQLSRRW